MCTACAQHIHNYNTSRGCPNKNTLLCKQKRKNKCYRNAPAHPYARNYTCKCRCRCKTHIHMSKIKSAAPPLRGATASYETPFQDLSASFREFKPPATPPLPSGRPRCHPTLWQNHQKIISNRFKNFACFVSSVFIDLRYQYKDHNRSQISKNQSRHVFKSRL